MGAHTQRDAAMTAGTKAVGCPRCGARDIRQAAVSPVPGRWVMRACQTCWYVWRSTEPDAATRADQYPPSFRLDPHDITGAPRMV
jgi:hypothetical protein